jgi:hypothetical protein
MTGVTINGDDAHRQFFVSLAKCQQSVGVFVRAEG